MPDPGTLIVDLRARPAGTTSSLSSAEGATRRSWPTLPQEIRDQSPEPNAPVFRGGSSRPNATFVLLCQLAGIRPKLDIVTGQQVPWHLKDLRKTCATYYDEHIPESSIEILGHAVGGITYRHYAHRDPLAFRAIMAIPQPSAFLALVTGHDGECPCCRRPFKTAD